VLVVDELGAPERRGLLARRGRVREIPPEPEPVAVATGRATVIFVTDPLDSEAAAVTWLDGVGEDELLAGLAVINRALHGLRLVVADPDRHEVGREQLLVGRVGYGVGEQVADGRWEAAREVMAREERRSRTRVLQPQARLAALLGGRDAALVCEELTLRARGDLARGRQREAALELLVALDAALAELPRDRQGAAVAERVSELRAQRDEVADAAQAALAGELSEAEREVVEFTLGRIEAALRARAVASA
jgi:hypothetical protein